VTELSFGKCKIIGNCIHQENNAGRVFIGSQAFTDIMYLFYHAPQGMEWGAYLIGTIESNTDYNVEKIYVPKQEVSATCFEFKEDLADIMEKQLVDDEIILGTIHRHPGELNTFSTTDEEWLAVNYLINLIITSSAKISAFKGIDIPCSNEYKKVVSLPIILEPTFYSVLENIATKSITYTTRAVSGNIKVDYDWKSYYDRLIDVNLE